MLSTNHNPRIHGLCYTRLPYYSLVKEKTQIQPKLYCESTDVPITEESEMLELE